MIKKLVYFFVLAVTIWSCSSDSDETIQNKKITINFIHEWDGTLVTKDDFNEIYNEFIQEKAGEQASRCSQCGVPFCQVHCPLSNNIPDWLKLTAEGRLKEAYELENTPMKNVFVEHMKNNKE